MREKILLIDGHSILNRTYYGLPDLTNSEGLHTNAVYGFLNILFRLLEEEDPQYLAVAFDLPVPTFRHKMFDDYKGTRRSMPEELREQVPLMQEVLRAMEIPVLTLEGYEADDILGTMARRSQERGLDVTILSGDRDLLQLATDQVLIRIPKTRGGKTTIEDYRAGDVEETYGLTPRQFIELKALMGDSADNIPGIPGVGEKTGTRIIQAYDSVENAHAHLEEIKPNKARESLRDYYDQALLSKALATIHTDIPLAFDYEEARLGRLYTEEAYSLFARLDFKKLLIRFDESALEKSRDNRSVEILSDPDQRQAFLESLTDRSRLGLGFIGGEDRLSGRYLPIGLAVSDGERTVYLPADESFGRAELAGLIRSWLADAAGIYTWGMKDMITCLSLEEDPLFFDCRIAAYLLNPLVSDYPYDSIAREYGNLHLPAAEEIFQAKKMPAPEDMDRQQAAEYAGSIALGSLVSAPFMEDKLKEAGMWKLFCEVEMPLVFTICDMERAGICVQAEELKHYGDALQTRIEELEEIIYRQAGEVFNLNSPKQLGEILFEKMKLPGGKKTKTGYSTAAGVLEKLAPEVPFVNDLLEYRQLAKLKSTYADGLANYIAEDGRIHTRFHQTITATGRISSTEPNLQNIPVRMELGRRIRKVFVPAEGCLFLDADYSQIELRVLAHMSGDEKLIDAYRQEKDIHAITASQVFRVPFGEVTPELRRKAKAVNFGIVYGISSFGLSQGLSIDRKEAAGYIEKYFETYPNVKSFLDGLIETARETGYSATLFGRQRPVPELSSGNFMQRQFGERVAMNAPVQGTAADIIKIAMVRVNRRIKREKLRSRLLLQIHDELLIEAPLDERERAESILREEMTGAADLAVALEVDLHAGRSWFEAK